MTQLINLQRRIKAVASTKKVTRAMRLIATAAYGKLKLRHETLLGYKSATEEILAQLLKVSTKLSNPVLNPNDETNARPLFIVISSTRGLCGAFHSNLAQHAAEKLKFRRYQQPTFITVGKRARQLVIDAMQYRPKDSYTITAHYETLTTNTIPTIAHTTIATIMNQTTPFSFVGILSTSFRNLFLQNPKLRVVLPLSLQESSAHNADAHFLWEQHPATIIDQLADHYLHTTIQQALQESLLAENAARSVAMDSATSGAEKHMNILISQHNRIRQSLITREVTELSATL
jgi:F-type H+-transporting ATPase subunit gamma